MQSKIVFREMLSELKALADVQLHQCHDDIADE